MIIARTPFRLSFFGGGTDFPEFFRLHGGATLSATLDRYCYISIHRLSPFFRHRFRASYARTELVQSPREFEHPLIRECLLMLGVDEGLEITHIADLPGQTGLGSSSSFTVGLLNALHCYRGETTSAEQLAQEAITVERERVRDAGGHQDQYAAAFGGFLRVDYPTRGPARVRRLTLDDERERALEERLMLFYTGVGQSAQAILHRQNARVGSNAAALNEMRGFVDRAERILGAEGGLDDFGRLLHETWLRKRTLSAGITNGAIDAAYAAAREAGALGGKLVGAGGRGFLLVYAPPRRREDVQEALGELGRVSFRFSHEGSAIIYRTPVS